MAQAALAVLAWPQMAKVQVVHVPLVQIICYNKKLVKLSRYDCLAATGVEGFLLVSREIKFCLQITMHLQ